MYKLNYIFIIYKLMKYRKILHKCNTYFQKVIFSQVKYLYFTAKFFIFQCQWTELWDKHNTIKCKIYVSSSINIVFDKRKIRHSWNIHFFFTSFDEIKVIFTPKIWISTIYVGAKVLLRKNMKNPLNDSFIHNCRVSFAWICEHCNSNDHVVIILLINYLW